MGGCLKVQVAKECDWAWLSGGDEMPGREAEKVRNEKENVEVYQKREMLESQEQNCRAK